MSVDNSHPLFNYDPNKCVLCRRCIWVCRDKLGISVLGFAHRGFQRVVTAFASDPLGRSRCQECGECVRVCPVGALAFKDSGTGGRIPSVAGASLGANKEPEVYR